MKPLLFFFFAFNTFFLAAQPIKVITYNIRLDNAGDGPDRWDLRKEAFAKQVLQWRPHLLGLQEATPVQIKFLDKNLKGYRRYGVGREDGADKGEYSPIYYDTTRFSLLEARTQWLSPTPDTPGKGWDAACERILTLVTFRDRKSGDTILVANTHWDHVGKMARQQSAEIVERNLVPAMQTGRRVIFMGDLNVKPEEAPVLHLSTFLQDACPPEQQANGTFNGFKLDLKTFSRIDYIWLSPNSWKVLEYKVPQPKTKGRQLSDHFPVMVRLGSAR